MIDFRIALDTPAMPPILSGAATFYRLLDSSALGLDERRQGLPVSNQAAEITTGLACVVIGFLLQFLGVLAGATHHPERSVSNEEFFT